MLKLESVTNAKKQRQLRHTQQQLSMSLRMPDCTLLIKVNCATTGNLDQMFAYEAACIANCTQCLWSSGGTVECANVEGKNMGGNVDCGNVGKKGFTPVVPLP